MILFTENNATELSQIFSKLVGRKIKKLILSNNSLRHSMENTAVLDALAGGLALAIVLGGLVMLFKGMSAFK